MAETEYDIEAPEATPEQPRNPVTGQFAHKHPARLVGIAEKLGISQDEILAASTAELRDIINDIRLEKQFSRTENAVAEARERPRQADNVIAPPKAEPPADEKFEGEDDIAPQIVGILKGFRKEIKSLREENSQLKAYQQSQAVETFTQKADKVFNDLGADYEPFVGKGARHELENGSLEMELRNAIVKEAAKLAGDNASADAVISKIKQVAQARFAKLIPDRPKQDPKPERKAPAESTKPKDFQEWVKGGLARPTHRANANDDLPTGRDKAELAVKEYLGVNGASPEQEDVTQDDFL